MTDIRKTKVPNRISDIEAAEYQRKGHNIFASTVEDSMAELKMSSEKVRLLNFFVLINIILIVYYFAKKSLIVFLSGDKRCNLKDYLLVVIKNRQS